MKKCVFVVGVQLCHWMHVALIVALLGFHLSIKASDIFFLAGGREAGLANASVALEGTWSLFHNPAGICSVKSISFGFSHENPYMIKELGTNSFAGIVPSKLGCFGIAGSNFGTGIYKEQKYAFGYSRSFMGKIDVGILCDYLRCNLPEEYEAQALLAGEIGVVAHPVKDLKIGCHLFNPTGAKYRDSNGEIPLVFRTGAAWETEKYLVSTQVQLNTRAIPVFSVGSEITIIKNLAVRMGISTQENMSYTCGIGYKQSWIKGDFAIAHHPVLGYSAFLSLELALIHRTL